MAMCMPLQGVGEMMQRLPDSLTFEELTEDNLAEEGVKVRRLLVADMLRSSTTCGGVDTL